MVTYLHNLLLRQVRNQLLRDRKGRMVFLLQYYPNGIEFSQNSPLEGRQTQSDGVEAFFDDYSVLRHFLMIVCIKCTHPVHFVIRLIRQAHQHLSSTELNDHRHPTSGGEFWMHCFFDGCRFCFVGCKFCLLNHPVLRTPLRGRGILDAMVLGGCGSLMMSSLWDFFEWEMRFVGYEISSVGAKS